MNNAFLPFSKPSISEEAIAEVCACLRSGWITTGPRVEKFEAMLREYLSAPSAQSCISATGGLLMALLSLELKPGDEVITSPMTFAATLNTIVLAGGRPRLVDVERGTYNMDLSQVEAAVNARTRAIMPVHFAGLPVDMDPLNEIATRKGLRVIEDAAHAIGTEYRGRKIGSFGDTQVFSFHPNKNITTGEGGCVVTRDAAMQKQVDLLRFHGIDRSAFPELRKKGLPHYEIALAGYKFNMMDMQAALGIHQLPQLDGFIERRRQIVERYYQAFRDWEEMMLPKAPSFPHRHAWHLFAPLINSDGAGLTREEVMARLKAENIGTGLHYQAVHLSRYYGKQFGYRRGDFPNAEFISDRVITLPLFPAMTDNDQERVIAALKKVLKGQS